MHTEGDRADGLLAAAAAAFRAECARGSAALWAAEVSAKAAAGWPRDRRLNLWREVLNALPTVVGVAHDYGATVRLRAADGVAPPDAEDLRALLMQLHPWRKGPFELFDVSIDAEWRSDWKWRRVASAIGSLAGQRVLDVGCGNGYYIWRMLEAGARSVVGLDPSLLGAMQYNVLKFYQPRAAAIFLPLGSEIIDRDIGLFDTVFSLGVLYHRRRPLEHLQELKRALVRGGQLVLETLIVDIAGVAELVPVERYARMRNVWCVPSIDTVAAWLDNAGFNDVRCVDVAMTTVAEQRATPWMRFGSLVDCLDPDDAAKTVEGYPAPRRALFLARVR